MNGSKNILYVGGFELPDKNAAAQRVLGVGKILSSIGYKVHFMGVDRSLLPGKGTDIIGTKRNFEGFNYYSAAYPNKLNDWFFYLFGISEIKKLIGELDTINIVIAYNYPAAALARLRAFCKTKNIRLIADCTEWYQPKGTFIFNVIKSFDTFFRMRIIHPTLDGIFAISKYLYSYYASKGSNVIYLPPVVDTQSVKWNDNIHKRNSGLTLAYAGSPGAGSKDRIDVIIHALSIVRKRKNINFSLNIIGISKEQYIRDFSNSEIFQEIEPWIIFKGKLSHLESLDEIKNADYAIFFRNTNLVNTAGFPTKLVEAFACGTPVLTNNFSNISDYVVDGVNGYLLDISCEPKLVERLSVALSQDFHMIDKMKQSIKHFSPFDFRGFINPMTNFIQTINC